MRSVSVATLKNPLSSYLRHVRAGEELILRDRMIPITKIVPLAGTDLDEEAQSLIAEGLAAPPKRPSCGVTGPLPGDAEAV